MSEKLVISYPIEPLPNQVVGHQICLNNIGRANALVPELISALAAALDEAENAQAKLIILCANGKHFSTGGDIQRFSAACANGNGESYARNLVSQLQAVVLKMLSMPAIIIVGAQGAITGGSCGLLFAADIGVLDRTSFIQPFYREVGFAPDGGWTALLPEIIGPKNTAAILHQNLQIDANQAVQMGIAQHIAEHEELRHNFKGFRDKLDDYNIDIKDKIALFFYNWLTKHILTSDMEYKSYALSIEEESFVQ